MKKATDRLTKQLAVAFAITIVMVLAMVIYTASLVKEHRAYQHKLNSLPVLIDYGFALTQESRRGYVMSKVPWLVTDIEISRQLQQDTDQSAQATFNSDFFLTSQADKEYRQEQIANFKLTRQALSECMSNQDNIACSPLGDKFMQEGTNLHAHLVGSMTNLFFQTPIYEPVITDRMTLMRTYLNYHQAVSKVLSTISVLDASQGSSSLDSLATRFNAAQLEFNKLGYLLKAHRQSFSGELLDKIEQDKQAYQHLMDRYIYPMLEGSYQSNFSFNFDIDESRSFYLQLHETLHLIEKELSSQYHQLLLEKTAKRMALIVAALLLLIVLFVYGRGIRRQAIIPLQENEAILRSAAAGIVQINAQDIMIRVNPAALSLFGYAETELLGQNVKILMPDSYAEHHDQYLANQVNTGVNKIIGKGREVVALNKQGEAFPIHLAISRVDGVQDLSFIGFVTDLREREAERKATNLRSKLLGALKKATEEFVAITDNQDQVWDDLLHSVLEITDSEQGFIGEVLFRNNGERCLKIHAITNISWDEPSYQLYEKLKSQDMLLCSDKTMIGLAMHQEQIVIGNDMQNDPRGGHAPPGHPPLRKYMGVPIFQGGELVGVYGIANSPEDYSLELAEFLEPFNNTCGVLIASLRQAAEQKDLLKKLEIEKRNAEQAAEAKAHFLANMSHEVRTPMNAILGMSHLALKHSLITSSVIM